MITLRHHYYTFTFCFFSQTKWNVICRLNVLMVCLSILWFSPISRFPGKPFGTSEWHSCRREFLANGSASPYGMLGNRAGSCTAASARPIRRKYDICYYIKLYIFKVMFTSITLRLSGQIFLWCGWEQDPERLLHIRGLQGEISWYILSTIWLLSVTFAKTVSSQDHQTKDISRNAVV